jgi:hypothetical protein
VVSSVHGAYARALVGVAEFPPAAVLALLLRRWDGRRGDVQAPAGDGACMNSRVVDDVELPVTLGVGVVEYLPFSHNTQERQAFPHACLWGVGPPHRESVYFQPGGGVTTM